MSAPPIIGAKAAFKDALKTKSGLVGFGMLFFLIALVIVVPIYAPYDVVSTWGDIAAWTDNPRNAAPEWVDIFSERKLSRTILVDWDGFRTAESDTSEFFKVIVVRTRWEIGFDQFPTELKLQMLSNWTDRKPVITVDWERPDGETVTIHSGAPARRDPFVEVLPLSSMVSVRGKVRDWAIGLGADDVEIVRPHVGLNAVQGPGMLDLQRAEVLKGQYKLTLNVIAFHPDDSVQARFISYGSVYGVVGTDQFRRDLLIGLLWGAPVALAFGAAAAVMTVAASVILGTLGAFYGGRFDEFVQRATDFVIILPALPVLILIGVLYRPSILGILLIVVAFGIVGPATKVVRTIALQVKEELHIEAAQSYGAPRARILFRYIIPRTMPYTFALLALAVPGFIFLEAALSFIGLGDPVLPTWGAIMGEASRSGALYNGLWWWVAFPALGIMFATVAFAFLGYAFDKVLNPRLREE